MLLDVGDPRALADLMRDAEAAGWERERLLQSLLRP
jgi:hypothetical protein